MTKRVPDTQILIVFCLAAACNSGAPMEIGGEDLGAKRQETLSPGADLADGGRYEPSDLVTPADCRCDATELPAGCGCDVADLPALPPVPDASWDLPEVPGIPQDLPQPADIQQDTPPPPACSADGDCVDGIGCTVDTCLDPGTEEAECVHTTDHGACDDGLWCSGDEFCDPDAGCTSGPLPCPDDGLFCNGQETCDEAGATCQHTGEPCDDDAPCTIDSCNEDAGGCQHLCVAANPGDPCCAEPGCNGSPSCIGNPVIDAITPPGQGLGEIIVIAGSDFGAAQGNGYVRLCGLKVANVQYWGAGTIVLTLPPGTHSGPVVVVDPWGFESNPYPYVVDYRKAIEGPFKVWEPTVFSVKDVGYYTVGLSVEMEPGWIYLYTPTVLTTWNVSDTPTPVSTVALPSQALDLELVGPHLFVTGSFGLEIYRTTDLQAGGFPSIAPPVRAAYSGVKAGATANADIDGEVTVGGTPLHGTLVALMEWTMPEAASNRVLFFQWDAQTETLDPLGAFHDPVNLNDKVVYDGILWPHPTAPKLVLGECTGIVAGTCSLREYDVSDLDALCADPAAAHLGAVSAQTGGLGVPRDLKPYGDRIWVGIYGANLDTASYAAFHAFDLSPDGPPVHSTWIDACSTVLTRGTVPDEIQPCANDADCPGETNLCTNGWCVDRMTCFNDADCPANQDTNPATNQDCLAGWCQTPCAVDADCTKQNTSKFCKLAPPSPCICIDGHCQVCRADHMGALDVVPEAGLAVGITGTSTDQPEKHNVFLFNADAGPGEHLPLASAETANWAMDVAGVPGRIAVADEWTGSQLFDYETTQADGLTGFAEPAWADPQNRIFSPGWALHVRQHPVIHGGRVYWGQGGIVGGAVDDLGDPAQWVSHNQQHASPYTRTAGDGRKDALLFKGFIENFITGMKPSHYQLYHANPESGELTLLNDPLAQSCPSMGEVLWWDDHVALSAEFQDGLAALYVDPGITNGTKCAEEADCGPIGDQCSTSACIDGTCRCSVVERRILVEPLDAVSGLFGATTTGSWIELERVDEDTVAAGQGWTYEPVLKPLSPTVPSDWGGLFFFDVGYPDGAPPSPDAPDLGIALTPSDPPALNCTRGRRLWSLDSMEIEGETWLLGVLDTDAMRPFVPHVYSIFLVRVTDIPTMNAACLAPDDKGYNAQLCGEQLTAMSILHPTTGQFSPSFTSLGVDTHVVAELWEHAGVPHVAVANRFGIVPLAATDHAGVWVFNVDDPDAPGFDLNRIHEPNLYFQPLAFSSSFVSPDHFTGHTDVNTNLIPEAADLERLDDGDILVFGSACTIARMGTP